MAKYFCHDGAHTKHLREDQSALISLSWPYEFRDMGVTVKDHQYFVEGGIGVEKTLADGGPEYGKWVSVHKRFKRWSDKVIGR